MINTSNNQLKRGWYCANYDLQNINNTTKSEVSK